MNFEELKRRVDRTEALVDGRMCQVTERHADLRREWRAAWTPLRIVVAGLAAGFVVGRTDPQRAMARLDKLGRVGGPRALRLVSSLSSLMTSVQATMAAMTAKQAADTADAAADTADDAADTVQQAARQHPPGGQAQAADAPDAAQSASGQAPPSDRRRPDPAWAQPPAPAEAATELSERER